MYLSRVYLDLSNRNTLKAVNSRSVLHGAVEAALTDDRSRKLWRIDSLGGELYLMILSNQKPDLSVIASQFGDTGRAGETRELLSATQNAKSGKRRDKPKLSGINQHKADCYAVCCVSQVVYPARFSKVSCQKNRCVFASIFLYLLKRRSI